MNAVRVYWDIDGTLIGNGPSGENCFLLAVKQVTGQRPPHLDFPRHGQTDRQIIRDYVQLLYLPERAEVEIADALIRVSESHFGLPGARLRSNEGPAETRVSRSRPRGFRLGRQ